MFLELRIRQARRDPNEFARYAFVDSQGRPLTQANIHRQMQTFLTANPRALVELPRDHGKSMQLCVRLAWELGHRRNLRIKLVCATEAIAAERGRFLRQALQNNGRVRLVFPDLEPRTPWSDTRFTILRPAEAIGPSVTALGIGAALTGTRADLLVCDDVVDVRALRSAADRERAKTYFRENLVNLLEPGGRIWSLFTPWHRDDLNAELKVNASYRLFRRAVGDNLGPVWPEKWPKERLEERLREIGETAFARGYQLVCAPDDALLIKPESIHFWSGEQQYGRKILSVDPAISTNPRADCSALVTLGETENHQVHCLEAIARRVAAPDLVEMIGDADRRWNPDLILFEAVGGFAALFDLMRYHSRFGGKLVKANPQATKAARVEALGVHVAKNRFLLQGVNGSVVPGQQALFDEMTAFPLGEHDDLVDSAALGVEFLLNHPSPRVW
jgi:phage terminase large subunit-like protein